LPGGTRLVVLCTRPPMRGRSAWIHLTHPGGTVATTRTQVEETARRLGERVGDAVESLGDAISGGVDRVRRVATKRRKSTRRTGTRKAAKKGTRKAAKRAGTRKVAKKGARKTAKRAGTRKAAKKG